jgi:hypothetical protein
MRVIRFILSCLLALSFIGSAPAVAAMATQLPTAQASDCKMAGKMPGQPADHGKMACCTSDCTMAGAAAVAEPGNGELSEPLHSNAVLASMPVKPLDSLDWATVDPPPRA